jgi:hypothetical protein
LSLTFTAGKNFAHAEPFHADALTTGTHDDPFQTDSFPTSVHADPSHTFTGTRAPQIWNHMSPDADAVGVALCTKTCPPPLYGETTLRR